jgi:uncharacterized protein (TIGR01777 family)
VRVAITGSHGLIGTALAARLLAEGHTPVPVVRGAPSTGEVGWDPAAGRLRPDELVGLDAVVNLAGAGLADKRWNEARKRELLDSRLRGTRLLAEALGTMGAAPPPFLSGSAIGFYGSDRGDEPLTEDSGPGHDFLAELCQRWEEATEAAGAAGARVVLLRTGIVLSRAGGALKKQLPLFKVGVGGRLGSGHQQFSWISIDDEVGAILFALGNPSVQGPVNLTAPSPVSNAEFTAALGAAVHRPAIVPVPALALKTVFGSELAEQALLGGQRVLPAALQAAGYEFRHPNLKEALANVLT